MDKISETYAINQNGYQVWDLIGYPLLTQNDCCETSNGTLEIPTSK